VALAHATPVKNVLSEPVGFGDATTDHAVPFHRSTRVALGPLGEYSPTAKQVLVLTQDTLCRKEELDPAGFGLGASDQEVPFQRSTKEAATLLDAYCPTAKQLVVLTQDRPCRKEDVDPAGLGFAMIDHEVPFHRSIRECPVVLIW
jgi:hypothetical protein